MDDQAAAVETVSSAHITGCASASISSDGTTAMIVFTIANADGADRRFALTLPANQLEWFRGIAHSLIAQAGETGVSAGNPMFAVSVNPQGGEDVQVGTSEQLPERVVLTFNPKRPEQMSYVLTFGTGLALANLMKDAIMPKLSLEQRRQLQLIKPKNKIIVPS